MNKILGLSWILCSCLLMQCAGTKNDSGPQPSVTPPLSGDFDFDLFRTETDLYPGNVIISPLSVKQVLLMITAAASNQGLDELSKALKIDDLQQSLAANRQMLNTIDKTEEAEIGLANLVFHDPSRITLLPDFKNQMQQYFNAGLEKADFSKAEAVTQVNQWVSDQTRQRIRELLQEISSDEAIFLINTLYMKADWEEAFDERISMKRPFWLNDRDSIHTMFMYADRSLKHAENKGIHMVKLPLKNSEISVLLLQNESGTVDELIQKLNQNTLNTLEENLSQSRFLFYLPRFELEYSNENMRPSLEKLGIRSVFKENGHLNNLAENKNTILSRVIHKTYLSVDEKGVEGAAVTAGGISVTSLPPSIVFDKPFVMVIRHEASGSFLFMSRISNPTKG